MSVTYTLTDTVGLSQTEIESLDEVISEAADALARVLDEAVSDLDETGANATELPKVSLAWVASPKAPPEHPDVTAHREGKAKARQESETE